MSLFFIPIEGLTVVSTLDVGPVQVRPAADVLIKLRGELSTGPFFQHFEQLVHAQRAGAIAQVEVPDRDAAVDLVAQAVDVLRVFQHMRYGLTRLTHFGIAGDIGSGIVPYAQIGDRTGHGSLHRGESVGWTFSESDAWQDAKRLRAVAGSIGQASPPEGHRRALIGLQLLSQALVEQRAAFKMVEVVSALEAWLLPRRSRGQTYRLARAVAFFDCGRQDANLCGRGRETCPYLDLDPTIPADLNRLKDLRRIGSEPPWRCSEWHRVVDWYDLRSEVVHGGGPVITMKDASNAAFWVYRYLAEPVLKWLTDHAAEPIADLDRALAALPAAPDWEARLGPLRARD